jgi:hypothetical protein
MGSSIQPWPAAGRAAGNLKQCHLGPGRCRVREADTASLYANPVHIYTKHTFMLDVLFIHTVRQRNGSPGNGVTFIVQ